MRSRILKLIIIATAVMPAGALPARAHQPGSCPRVVIFTLPGITWDAVEAASPPHLSAAVEDGAIGSMSVRTNASRTSYASGFASIGAGARVDGGRSSGYVEGDLPEEGTASAVAAGVGEMRTLLDIAGYTTVVPGALAEALDGQPVSAIGNADLGLDPPTPMGRGRWSLLAAMDAEGRVDLSATGSDLIASDAEAPYGVVGDNSGISEALEAIEVPCMTSIIDPGDTTRADAAATNSGRLDNPDESAALLRADAVLGEVRERLHSHSDLLIIVAPTSPGWDPEVHFGVAVVVGEGFPAGSLLESPSTRRTGLVTLPDIAPTVLQHFATTRPPSMLGRAMFAVTSSDPDRVSDQIHLDEESVFIDAMRTPISSGFVIGQVLLYIVVALVLRKRGAPGPQPRRRLPDGFVYGALAVVGFPLATYLAGLTDQLAFGPWGFVGLLLALDVSLVVGVCVFLKAPFDRLLGVTFLTYLVLVVDLMTGANLQVNTVFSYSPLVAGRFAGIGNIAYSVLAAVTVISAALLVHRLEGSRRALVGIGVLFTIAVIVDAAPTFGSDVGGILALVPGLSITWMLLAGRRPRLRTIAFLLVGMIASVALFLALDLAQPEESRTHLARLFEDVRGRGFGVLGDVIRRKAETNLRVFRSTIWTYLVPPALGLIAWLLLRPRNRWQRVAETYPRLRAGLVSCLVVAVLGFAVNDSGIVVPAMMLSFLAPMALVMYLSLDEEAS